MNKKVLKMVLDNESLFVPLLFTKKQFSTAEKYYKGMKLSNAGKKSLYTSITKKINALERIQPKNSDYYINGSDNILPERIEKAKKIIEEYSKEHEKVFISGSFLFSEKYEDIDIFILREKKYDEKFENGKHIVFLTEKRLKNPVFQSARLISVANFIIPSEIKEKQLKLIQLMSSYHEATIEIRGSKEREIARYIVFSYYLKIENKLLDGLEMKNITGKLTINQLEEMVKKLLNTLFSKKYLYVAIHPYIKTLSEFIATEKNTDNLKQYKKLYEEVIYAPNRSTAKT